jgi:hypothetical protein
MLQQAGLARLAPGFAIHVVLFAPAGVEREHLRLDEAHGVVAEDFEVFVHPGRYVWIH